MTGPAGEWHGIPRRVPAIAAMLTSAICFAAMGAFAKAAASPQFAGSPMPAAQSVLFRFAFGVVVMLPLLFVPGANLLGNDRRGLILRGLSGGLAVYFYFLAISKTTLANAVLLNFTSVVFAPVFALLFLRERLDRAHSVGMVVALLGTGLVTRIGIAPPNIGDGAGLLSGLLAGVALATVRRLRRNETASSVFFYFSLVGLPVAGVGCLFEPLIWPTTQGWLLLFGTAATSVAAQMLMTYGYRYVPTVDGVLMTLSQVVYTAIIGVAVFHETPTASTLIGGGLIMASAGYSVFVGARKAREQ